MLHSVLQGFEKNTIENFDDKFKVTHILLLITMGTYLAFLFVCFFAYLFVCLFVCLYAAVYCRALSKALRKTLMKNLRVESARLLHTLCADNNGQISCNTSLTGK